MHASQYHINTLKEAPTEAEVASHQLMTRAGMIRKAAGGIYTYMPMGLRVLRPDSDEQHALARKLPRGRVFAVGAAPRRCVTTASGERMRRRGDPLPLLWLGHPLGNTGWLGPVQILQNEDDRTSGGEMREPGEHLVEQRAHAAGLAS